MILQLLNNKLQFRYFLDKFCIQFENITSIYVLPLFYKGLRGFYNLSKTYLRQKTCLKLPKYCNHRKTRNPLFYAGSRAYLPQHCLYLRPEPHGHGSFLPTFFVDFFGVDFTPSFPSLVLIFFTSSLSIFYKQHILDTV